MEAAEKKERERKIKPDFEVYIIERNRSERAVVKFTDVRMRLFLQANERCIVSDAGNLIRVTGSEDGKPYAVESLPEVARCALRCLHEMTGGRTIESLATEAQLVRARQLAEILSKRPDNSILLPTNPDKFTHGQIGRWIGDAKNMLIADGRWDDEEKREIEKEPRKSNKSGKCN